MNRVIYVDFSLETRDLFRAYLDLYKRQLLIGLGLSLCLIATLVALFLWLDEKVVLLQTSPLFIFLPLIATGGQVLRLHAACRKYVSSLPPASRRVQFSFSDDTDGFDVNCGNSFSHVAWTDVCKIVEKRKFFQLFLSKFDVRILPKRGFAEAHEISFLRKILVSRLGTRAEVLD
jgi:hypothetical protein